MATLYDWIRVLQPEIRQIDSIPLTATPPFPWDTLGERLAEVFKKNSITFKTSEPQWKPGSELKEGLGKNPFALSLSILPLEGNAYWLMPAEAVPILKRVLLSVDDHSVEWSDKILDDSFSRFLTLEVLYQLTEIIPTHALTPILGDDTTMPTHDSLCIDITVTIDQQSISGRLVISPTLRKAWVNFIEQNGLKNINLTLAEKIEAALHIEAGSSQINLKQWTDIKEGDFLLLDHCSLEGAHFEGRVMLTASGHPIFRAKIKGGNIKILEFPFYHEVESPMGNEFENDEDKLKDENESLPSEEEFDLTEETPSDEGLMSEEEAPAEEPEAPTEEPVVPPVRKAKISKPLPPQDIPVSVVVEVGRIQITVAKLLELEPGNYLDLDVKPEQGVDLVINGKVVGKGELMKLGDALGVRIVELG